MTKITNRTKKVAVITGASQGLGLAMTRNLVDKGYTVVLVSRTRKKLETAAASVSETGSEVVVIPTDVSDPAAVAALAKEVKELFGSVDFLINNAGIFTTELVENIPVEQVKKDLDVTLLGSILCTREFIPILKPDSRILFVSSAFGLMGAAGYSVYCAAKAGIINFAEAIRRELKSRQIHIYVSTPADIDTPAFREEEENMPEWMSMARARPRPISAELAAECILSQCRGDRFIIFSDLSIRMLHLVQQYAPKKISSLLLDSVFPRPDLKNTTSPTSR